MNTMRKNHSTKIRKFAKLSQIQSLKKAMLSSSLFTRTFLQTHSICQISFNPMNLQRFFDLYKFKPRICLTYASQSLTQNQSKRNFKGVAPDASPATPSEMESLHDFIMNSKKLLVLTGAGISTESGIPDYRSPNGAYSKGYKPMTHQDFVRSDLSRKRYWARSYMGWIRFVSANPGPTHVALRRLESRNRIAGGMITQNVDRLHHYAGSFPIELHGSVHETVCLQCGIVSDRNAFQERLKNENMEWAMALECLIKKGEVGNSMSFGMKQRPDGDVEIDERVWNSKHFILPLCENCGGIIKPNVVLFGDNVPKLTVAKTNSMVENCDSLLVVGSSLYVLSAYRIAKAVSEAIKPLAIINIGDTRADDLVTLKIQSHCGEVLTRLMHMGSIDVPVF